MSEFMIRRLEGPGRLNCLASALRLCSKHYVIRPDYCPPVQIFSYLNAFNSQMIFGQKSFNLIAGLLGEFGYQKINFLSCRKPDLAAIGWKLEFQTSTANFLIPDFLLLAPGELERHFNLILHPQPLPAGGPEKTLFGQLFSGQIQINSEAGLVDGKTRPAINIIPKIKIPIAKIICDHPAFKAAVSVLKLFGYKTVVLQEQPPARAEEITFSLVELSRRVIFYIPPSLFSDVVNLKSAVRRQFTAFSQADSFFTRRLRELAAARRPAAAFLPIFVRNVPAELVKVLKTEAEFLERTLAEIGIHQIADRVFIIYGSPDNMAFSRTRKKPPKPNGPDEKIREILCFLKAGSLPGFSVLDMAGGLRRSLEAGRLFSARQLPLDPLALRQAASLDRLSG